MPTHSLNVVRSGDPGPIRELVEEFLESVRTSDRSSWTVAAYKNPLLRLFVPFAETRGALEAEDLNPALIDAFARYLQTVPHGHHGGQLSKATVRTYLKAVQQFLSWLKKQREAEVSPEKVPLPPQRKVLREILSRDEIQRLESSARQERDKLIIRLMADFGMRESEVISIRIEDLIQKERRFFYVRVRGKTGERQVPINAGLFRRLSEHAKGRPHDARSNRLFLAERRSRGEWQPLGRSGVLRLFQDAAQRMGFERRAFPHLLRHSAITWLIQRETAENVVADITGASLQTIRAHYWQSNDEANWEAINRALREEE